MTSENSRERINSTPADSKYSASISDQELTQLLQHLTPAAEGFEAAPILQSSNSPVPDAKSFSIQIPCDEISKCIDQISNNLPNPWNITSPNRKYYFKKENKQATLLQIKTIEKIIEYIQNLALNTHCNNIIKDILTRIKTVDKALPDSGSIKHSGATIVHNLKVIKTNAVSLSQEFDKNPPPLEQPPVFELSMPSKKPEKKGRNITHDYTKTPSLNLNEWHEFYWWPTEDAIDLELIHYGFSTLVIVLIGTETNKRVYFYRNHLLLKTKDANEYLCVTTQLNPTELQLLARNGFGYIPRQLPIQILSTIPKKTERLNNSYIILTSTNPYSLLYSSPTQQLFDTGFKIQPNASNYDLTQAVYNYRNNLLDPLALKIIGTAKFVRDANRASSIYAMAIEDQIQVVRPYGEEHAYRRVEMFLWLALYYYVNGASTEIIHHKTTEQGGQGSILNGFVSHASHSSILPSLYDAIEKIATGHNTRAGGGYTETWVWTLANLIFSDTLNSTVELPVYYNHFDKLIEAQIRKDALLILNQTAKKSLNPIEALTQFFIKIETHLKNKQKGYIENPGALIQSPPQVRHSVFDAEWEGTFGCDRWDSTTKQCNPAFIALALGIPEATWLHAVATKQEDIVYANIYNDIVSALRAEYKKATSQNPIPAVKTEEQKPAVRQPTLKPKQEPTAAILGKSLSTILIKPTIHSISFSTSKLFKNNAAIVTSPKANILLNAFIEKEITELDTLVNKLKETNEELSLSYGEQLKKYLDDSPTLHILQQFKEKISAELTKLNNKIK
jgi:hypothetical protein